MKGCAHRCKRWGAVSLLSVQMFAAASARTDWTSQQRARSLPNLSLTRDKCTPVGRGVGYSKKKEHTPANTMAAVRCGIVGIMPCRRCRMTMLLQYIHSGSAVRSLLCLTSKQAIATIIPLPIIIRQSQSGWRPRRQPDGSCRCSPSTACRMSKAARC